ncbi:MAG TPA: 3-hydroxyacyl-CoA dehydrogenase NAD-binding domain-containing protein [Flavobacteriales bacterium]|jgi:3-hydroxybutyryl-CoA dehydrogenase|nr:3-hydroxyacyl-CoA dehydrogenase NAD-binding domain-containing protein [Flavobacteriales bacterium]
MKKIAVIGAGTMGNGIAHTFAQFGFPVILVDVSDAALSKGIQAITQNLDRQVQKGILTEAQKTETLARISTQTQIDERLSDRDLVVEAASENFQIKSAVFKQLDQHCQSSCILASNTSSISITRIAAETKRPTNVIGMHFMNPVPVMKLVEIINGYSTSAETSRLTVELSEALQKVPVVVNDYPGFVANKILMPMINEAIITLQEGVAGVQEIDTVMKLGMAHPMGPLQLADFIGLDVCLSILRVLQDGFGNPKYAPSPLLVNMVMANQLGVKSGVGFYDYSAGIKQARVADQFA